MKKIVFLLSLFIFFSCKKEMEQSRIQGVIEGLTTDTIYLYGIEDLYDRVDTVFLEAGKFSVDLPIDTLTLLRMVVRDSLEYPLFIDHKEVLKISGSVDEQLHLKVESKNSFNKDYSIFLDSIAKNVSYPSDSVRLDEVKKYILKNNNSLVSVYLIDTYFVNVPTPDLDELKFILDRLTGELKDRHSISTMIEWVEAIGKVSVDKIAPYFSLKMSDGVSKTRTTFKNKYILLHFWASWDKQSRRENQRIKELYKKYKKEKELTFVSFSLDLDSLLWKDAIKEDSLVWDQSCDLKGWSSDFIKQYSISEIPTLILINPQSSIIGREIEVNSLTEQLDSLLKK